MSIFLLQTQQRDVCVLVKLHQQLLNKKGCRLIIACWSANRHVPLCGLTRRMSVTFKKSDKKLKK